MGERRCASPPPPPTSPSLWFPDGDPPLSPDAVPLDPLHPPVPYPFAEELISGPLPPRDEVFQQLYAREWEFVLRTVERYGVPSRDADDIAQEVFSVALRRIEDHDAASSARPWLFVIAMQLATNYRKLARHRIEPLVADWPPEPMSDTLAAESALLEGEEQALARELIGRMRPKLREILVLHDLEEQTMPEIAEKLGIPVKTAYARLKLARAEALRRGRALAASSLAVSTPRPMRPKDLLRVREVLLAYAHQPPRAARASRRRNQPVTYPCAIPVRELSYPRIVFPS
ncbi:RNA polymerase sigma factor [Polyangium fumosum]|uniref:Sigma-70 family RNA polymerase sigma factor n=1 Tax=Polyangium fumosum TaxID=889272 RepID=A0A4U1J7F2_9BACT|nr:sigma-70 family RNA polymerase sigma factor [Polyangium fumosum]TKD03256.1 sigma-70 family RNA polymerase sigma factor [Polyangium fumosum]